VTFLTAQINQYLMSAVERSLIEPSFLRCQVFITLSRSAPESNQEASHALAGVVAQSLHVYLGANGLVASGDERSVGTHLTGRHRVVRSTRNGNGEAVT
jgi:hypothetical protein